MLDRVWEFLQKLHTELPHDLAGPLLEIHGKGAENRQDKYVRVNVCCASVHNSARSIGSVHEELDRESGAVKLKGPNSAAANFGRGILSRAVGSLKHNFTWPSYTAVPPTS